MDLGRKPWIEGEVLGQVKILLEVRKSLYPDARAKKKGNFEPSEGSITRGGSVGIDGEVSISRKVGSFPPLQIRKWVLRTPAGSRFITGELSDKTSYITCEFTSSCVSSFEFTQGRLITELSIGNIIQLLEYDLIFQGSDGLLFWANYDYQDQLDHSKAAKKKGNPSESLPAKLRNPQLPVPEPRFRVHKFSVLSWDESPFWGIPQLLRKHNELKQILAALPRKALVDKNMEDASAEHELKEKTKPHTSAESDTDDECNFKSQPASPAIRHPRVQKSPEPSEDEDISQMALATQIPQSLPRRSGFGHYFAGPYSANTEVSSADKSEDRKRKMKDCATNINHIMRMPSDQTMALKKTKSASKAAGDKVVKAFENEPMGGNPKGIIPPLEHSVEQSSRSNVPLRTGINDVSAESKEPRQKLERAKKSIELIQLGTMLHSHPGWQGMKEVTRMDVTIPEGQLTILESDSAWYPREEHHAPRHAYPVHDDVIRGPGTEDVSIQSPACNECSPQSKSSALLPPPSYSDSESELSWSLSPVAQNIMPSDSSAIEPPETPVCRRSVNSSNRCLEDELPCSLLHFQIDSRCGNCHNADASCEYDEAAEIMSLDKRRQTRQEAIYDSSEAEQEGISPLRKHRHAMPTRKDTGEPSVKVATSASSTTSSSYADPELDDFSFSTNLTTHGSTLVQKVSTSEAPVSDTISVQFAGIMPTPGDQSSTQRIGASYEDPEFGNFSVVITKKPTDISTESQKHCGIKKRVSEGNLPPRSHVPSYLKKANGKEFPQGSSSRNVTQKPKHSAAACSGSDADIERLLVLNPHGMTNVAKFGILRSQNLALKKEEERKRQERLSLGLPEEESSTDCDVSEPEQYDGYSSSEDKEQERQRKARSITVNSSSEHNGRKDATHNSLTPTLDPDGFNLPSHKTLDVSSHSSSGGKGDKKVKSGHDCEQPVVTPKITPLKLVSPHLKVTLRPNNDKIGSLEDPLQAAPTSNINISSPSPSIHARSQLVVRESPRKLTVPESMVLGNHDENQDGEDEVPQASQTTYVAPQSFHVAVASTHERNSGERVIQPQEKARISDVAGPKGNVNNASPFANIEQVELTSGEQGLPPSPPMHVEKDIHIRDPPQPGPLEAALATMDNPTIQEVPFPTTASKRQGPTIQVQGTPYPLTKRVAYEGRTGWSVYKKNGSDENPASLLLEDEEEMIPGTFREPIRPQSFEVVIPVHNGLKRKIGEKPIDDGKKGDKRLRVRKVEFGSQEAQYKDLGDLAKEHKKRYLEIVSPSLKSDKGSTSPVLYGHINVGIQASDGQQTITRKSPVVAPLASSPSKPHLPVNIAIPSQALMLPPTQKPRVSPESMAQMSLSSMRSSTSSAHVKQRRKKLPSKPDSSTLRALKAIIAAKTAPSSGNLSGPMLAVNDSRTAVSTVSRRSSSTTSSIPQKVVKHSSSRNFTSHASAVHLRSLLDRGNLLRQTHLWTKTVQQHAVPFSNSDDSESDSRDVIPARPPPPVQPQVQKTLIPPVAIPPLKLKPEKIKNYADIEGRDVSILIPGYNRLSAEKKAKLNDLRKAYFGPGELKLQPAEAVTKEEEDRQKHIQEFRDRLKEPERKKAWWQEDDTPLKSYSRKLKLVKSVKRELGGRDEGLTTVEVGRLSRGGMVKNVLKKL